MIDTKQIVKGRYVGVAPEGFVLLHEKTIQDLQDFEIWKEWKNNIIELDLKNRIEIEENKKSQISKQGQVGVTICSGERKLAPRY